MFHISFILPLGLQHELLQHGVIASDDADFEFFVASVERVASLRTGDSEPVTAVKDGMSRICTIPK